jgi:hypothetical protein
VKTFHLPRYLFHAHAQSCALGSSCWLDLIL